MTAQSLAWAKTVMDTLLAKAAEPITANIRDAERANALFEDARSRQEHIQELAYKILYPALGSSQRAGELTGGLS